MIELKCVSARRGNPAGRGNCRSERPITIVDHGPVVRAAVSGAQIEGVAAAVVANVQVSEQRPCERWLVIGVVQLQLPNAVVPNPTARWRCHMGSVAVSTIQHAQLRCTAGVQDNRDRHNADGHRVQLRQPRNESSQFAGGRVDRTLIEV